MGKSIIKIKKVASLLVCLTCVMAISISANAQTRYHVEQGKVEFKSKAPLELIEAQTGKFLGVLDVDRKAFAISIPISTFRGFNSALQREHFNENYMETSKYPKGVYKGLITGDADLTKNGYYEVKTKGKLNLHGIEKVREFTCQVKVEGDLINVKADFDVSLAEHSIKIPRVVRYKLSEQINVKIDADFVLKK